MIEKKSNYLSNIDIHNAVRSFKKKSYELNLKQAISYHVKSIFDCFSLTIKMKAIDSTT